MPQVSMVAMKVFTFLAVALSGVYAEAEIYGPHGYVDGCTYYSTTPSTSFVAQTYASATSTQNDAVVLDLETVLEGMRNSGQLQGISELDLSGRGLNGTIPEWLGNLKSLTALKLSGNSLTGEIPSSLARLSQLRVLLLNDNQFTGEIPPALGTLQNLSWLDLSSNQLTGTIPIQLGNMSGLLELYLSNNRLQGAIPQQLGDLPRLVRLALDRNSLEGEIPNSLVKLANLTELLLWDNKLRGLIPPWLGSLRQMRSICLSDNAFTGTIPAALGELRSLVGLDLSDNQLQGNIPSELGQLSQLTYFDLDGNALTGPIPASLGLLSRLKYLALDGNQLVGEIPPQLGNLTECTQLWLSQNSLTGNIPSTFANLASIEILDMSSNRLSGVIPPQLGLLGTVTDLSVANNVLQGSIPPQLGNLITLHTLKLQSNHLTGSVPADLGRLAQLTALHLEDNHLEGELPSSLGALQALQFINLSQNRFSGGIPKELAALQSLEVLDLSENQLSGDVPLGLAQLVNLTKVSFAGNLLGPTLQLDLFENSRLEEVRLDGNRFEGSLPNLSQMSSLTMLQMDQNPGVSGVFPDTSSLVHLAWLSASHCSFSSVATLSTSLQYLDLAFNQLSDLPKGAEDLAQLQTLLLQGNRIRGWPLHGVATNPCSERVTLPNFRWGALRTLVVSHNPLSVKAQLFLDSLSYLALEDVQAENCSLVGEVLDVEVQKEGRDCMSATRPWPGFKRLQTLALANNRISTFLPCPTPCLRTASLAQNNLTWLPACWLALKGPLSHVDLQGNLGLTAAVSVKPCGLEEDLCADPLGFRQIQATSFECTGLQIQEGGKRLQVDGWSFNSSSLCRCAPGHSGQGTDCEECPRNTYWNRTGKVATCLSCGPNRVTAKAGSTDISECLCAAGLLPAGLGGCRCPDDAYFSSLGECMQCPALTGTDPGTVARGIESCQTQRTPLVHVLQAITILLLATAAFALPVVFGLPPAAVADVTAVDDKLVLTTQLHHHLVSWSSRPVPIRLTQTGHPGLDACKLWAKRLNKRQLCLCDEDGKPSKRRIETSMGFVQVCLPQALVICGFWSLPAWGWCLSCWGAAGFLASLTHMPPAALASAVLFSAVLALFVQLIVRFFSTRTPLSHERAEFLTVLHAQNPEPRKCPPGSGRAITARQLVDFYQHFQALIRGRNMYYLDSNILRPLTAKSKLSYSELAGPSQVQHFVSHYWGSPFQQFVATVRKHAESMADWQHQSYWICCFANNQWELDTELGGGCWQQSSFYKALRSTGCRGTLMVLDKDALPLQRAWCLFELFHTMLQSGQGEFQGLLLGTESGVLNGGQGNVDAALGVAQRLAVLDLRDAQASNLDDLAMIHQLVGSLDGGFDMVNGFIKVAIEQALKVVHSSFSETVDTVTKTLRSSSREGFEESCEKGRLLVASYGEEETRFIAPSSSQIQMARKERRLSLPPAHCLLLCVAVILIQVAAVTIFVTWHEWLF